MDEFRADLHCHSNCSDGTDTPKELLHLAKKNGLKGLSITDHDTVAAYTPELFEEAKLLGIDLLPGAEISTELKGNSVHILGYGYDIHSQALKEFLSTMQKKRNERNRAILHKLGQHRMPISEEELKAYATNRSIGRPHIAELMVKKGYVKSSREAFDKYLKEGGSCYTLGIKYCPQEAIDQIHKAGGLAVLAHPHFIKKRAFLSQLLELSFDGIECYYSCLATPLELPMVDLAQKKGLIATGGSDYHGAIKPNIALGCSWVGIETFRLLKGPR